VRTGQGELANRRFQRFIFLSLSFHRGARTRDLLCDRQAVCLPLSFIYSLRGALDELVRMREFGFSAEVRSNVGSWLRKYSDGESERYQNQHILRTGASIRSGASLVRKAADSCKCLKTIAGMSGIVRNSAVTVCDSNQRRGSVLTN